jgi:hypothetical protein
MHSGKLFLHVNKGVAILHHVQEELQHCDLSGMRLKLSFFSGDNFNKHILSLIDALSCKKSWKTDGQSTSPWHKAMQANLRYWMQLSLNGQSENENSFPEFKTFCETSLNNPFKPLEFFELVIDPYANFANKVKIQQEGRAANKIPLDERFVTVSKALSRHSLHI